MNDPRKILMMGDVHGNTRWTATVLWSVPDLLPDEDHRIVLQAGDFGFSGNQYGEAYLQHLDAVLASVNAELWVVDGNHEDHDMIAAFRQGHDPAESVLVPPAERIWHLPRGHRWIWHGRRWLACGGAASPDRNFRQMWELGNGEKTWWPGEYITENDVRRCAAGGHADVLVSHERPAKAYISLPPWPRGWTDEDHARCEVSRDMLQAVCNATTPRHVIHGHYHRPFSCEQHEMGYGMAQVSQLNMDGYDDNYRVLDIKTMQWEPRRPPSGGR